MAEPASEQTLQDLLAEAKAMNASLARLSSVLGKNMTSTAKADTSNSGADALAGLAPAMSKFLPALGPAGVALKLLGTAAEVLGGVFGVLGGLISGLFDKIGKVAGILTDFAKSAMSGNMKLSDMVDVMGKLAEQVPIVGGLLGMLAAPMKMVIQRQEESLEMFRRLASVGAGVGQSLETLRQNARSTGLTMSEYASQVEKNSKDFAGLGGTVDSGMKSFTKNMQAVMGPESKVSKAFFGMGYTAQGAADTLALYMLAQGTMNKRGLQDSNAVAVGAKNLAEQITFLSETTGKRKDQIEAEIKEAAEEANWKNYLASLDPEEAARASQAIAIGLARAGKDGADAVKLAIRTGITTPVTEGGKKLYMSTQGASEDWLKAVSDIKKPVDQYNKEVDSSTYKMGKSSQQFNDSLGASGAILTAQGKGVVSQGALNNATQMKNYKSEAEYNAAMAELRTKNKNAAGGDAANLAQQTQNLRQFGNIIDNIMGTLSGPFMKPIMSLMEAFQGVATKAAEWIKPKLEEFTKWLTPWTDKFVDLAKKGTWDDFKKTLGEFWTDIKAKAGPLIKDVWESTKPVLFDAIKNLFGFLWDALKASVIPRWMRSDTDSEKIEDAKKKKEKQEESIQKINDNIVKLEKEKAALGESWLDRQKKSVIENQIATQKNIKGNIEKNMAGGDSGNKQQSTSKTGSTTSPVTDQATNIRNWAYSLMTGQATESEIPSSIKDKVMEAQKDPDLKKQAESYKSEMAKRAADAKAKQDREAAEAKTSAEKPAESKAETATAPAVVTQEPAQDAATVLNSMVAQLIRVNTETAEATKKTANLIASNGNLFRR